MMGVLYYVRRDGVVPCDWFVAALCDGSGHPELTGTCWIVRGRNATDGMMSLLHFLGYFHTFPHSVTRRRFFGMASFAQRAKTNDTCFS